MLYGILKGSQNTGRDDELACVFSTPLAVRSNQPAFSSDSMSLRRLSNSQNVQRWEIEANIVPENDSSNFLVHTVRNGYTRRFPVRMPQPVRRVMARQDLALTLATDGVRGENIINVANALKDTFRPGDFFNLGGSTKVYMVVDAGQSGVGMEIAPSLRASHAAGLPITYGGKVTMQATYDSDCVLGIKYTDGILSDPGSVTLIEAI